MKIQVNARNRGHQFDAIGASCVLFEGLSSGVDLPYECGSGTCGTCKAKLVKGELADAWPQAPGRKYLKQPDEFLMCQCAPKSDLVVEVGTFVHPTDPAVCIPKTLKGHIATAKMLTHDVVLLDVDLERAMPFDAGQYALVQAPGIPGFRGWSMVNFEAQPRQLRFVVKKKPGGAVSDWLFAPSAHLQGSEVQIFGPLGHATFHPSVAKNLLCIAGGSGIAGMLSIVSRAVQDRYFEKFDGDVFFGVRTMRDAFFLQEFAQLCQAAGSRLKVTMAFSDEDVSPEFAALHPHIQFDRGFVHEVAKRHMQGRFDNLRAYIAGPPPAVDQSIRFLLLEARVPADQIKYDKFS